RDLPGSDRLRVASPQATDDAQVVGAAGGGGKITVPAGDHEGLREVICRFVDLPADQGDGAPRIESVTLDRLLVTRARLAQRPIEPPESFIVAPEPRLRGPVQQRQAQRILELAPARAEVVDHLGVVSRHGQLLGPLDYVGRRVHRVSPLLSGKPPDGATEMGHPAHLVATEY